MVQSVWIVPRAVSTRGTLVEVVSLKPNVLDFEVLLLSVECDSLHFVNSDFGGTDVVEVLL